MAGLESRLSWATSGFEGKYFLCIKSVCPPFSFLLVHFFDLVLFVSLIRIVPPYKNVNGLCFLSLLLYSAAFNLTMGHEVLRTVISVNWMRYKAGRKYPIPIRFINNDLNDSFKKGAYIRR